MNDIYIQVHSDGMVAFSDSTIGYVGENKARRLLFVMDDFVDGEAILEIQQGENKYFLKLDKEENTYFLPIYKSLLVLPTIKMQFIIHKDKETILKSEVFTLKIKESIGAIEETIPEEYENWLTTANEKIQEIDNMIKDLNQKIEEGYFNGKEGPQGPQGEPGKDGTLTFEELTPEQKESLSGKDGQDGVNGLTPTIGANGNWFIGETDTGVLARGVNGTKGEQGLPGEKGDPFLYEDFTEEQLASLKGPKGDTGDQGPQGVAGQDGVVDYTRVNSYIDEKLGSINTILATLTIPESGGTSANE